MRNIVSLYLPYMRSFRFSEWKEAPTRALIIRAICRLGVADAPFVLLDASYRVSLGRDMVVVRSARPWVVSGLPCSLEVSRNTNSFSCDTGCRRTNSWCSSTKEWIEVSEIPPIRGCCVPLNEESSLSRYSASFHEGMEEGSWGLYDKVEIEKSVVSKILDPFLKILPHQDKLVKTD